jgi:hypothetical protein
LNEADTEELNAHLGSDQFIFQYVRDVKSRGDQDDKQFMGVLKESLKTFKTLMQKKKADAEAALSFSLDPEDRAPLPDTSKGDSQAKKNGNNGKSKQVSIYLYFLLTILKICRIPFRNPGPPPIASRTPFRNPCVLLFVSRTPFRNSCPPPIAPRSPKKRKS